MGDTYFVGMDGRTDGVGRFVCLLSCSVNTHGMVSAPKHQRFLGLESYNRRDLLLCPSPLLDTVIMSFMLIGFCC